MGTNADEMDALRQRMTDLADKLGVVVTRVEVSAAKLEAASAQITRMDATLDETRAAVLVLQTRANDASRAGAKWGGVVGGAIGAAAWLYSLLGGK